MKAARSEKPKEILDLVKRVRFRKHLFSSFNLQIHSSSSLSLSFSLSISFFIHSKLAQKLVCINRT